MRSRRGITFENGISRIIICTVIGEMIDGRKVWSEIVDGVIDTSKQYLLVTSGNWSEFIPL